MEVLRNIKKVLGDIKTAVKRTDPISLVFGFIFFLILVAVLNAIIGAVDIVGANFLIAAFFFGVVCVGLSLFSNEGGGGLDSTSKMSDCINGVFQYIMSPFIYIYNLINPSKAASERFNHSGARSLRDNLGVVVPACVALLFLFAWKDPSIAGVIGAFLIISTICSAFTFFASKSPVYQLVGSCGSGLGAPQRRATPSKNKRQGGAQQAVPLGWRGPREGVGANSSRNLSEMEESQVDGRLILDGY